MCVCVSLSESVFVFVSYKAACLSGTIRGPKRIVYQSVCSLLNFRRYLGQKSLRYTNRFIKHQCRFFYRLITHRRNTDTKTPLQGDLHHPCDNLRIIEQHGIKKVSNNTVHQKVSNNIASESGGSSGSGSKSTSK